MEEMCFIHFLKMAKDSAARIELGRLFHQEGTFTFSHLADAFIQSDLQMRTMEAIKINKRAICKCYDRSQLA